MRVLIFSDIHNDLRALGRLMDTEADLYIAAGDLVSWSRGLDDAGKVLQRRADRVWVLPGNHESQEQIQSLCDRFGLHPFHGVAIEREGWHIAGLGYSSPTPFNTPGEYSEQELSERLAPFAGKKPLLLVCHAPPKGTPLDRAKAGQHFGSQAVLEFLNVQQPAYFFCGHIHEAEGVSAQLGATFAVNVGKRGYLLELDPARFDKIEP